MNRKASIPFDFSLRNELLKDPENAIAYLEGCLEDGNMQLFREALQNVAKAQGGIQALAMEAKLNRESLYKALSKKGKPQMETITKVLNALGLRFSLVPLKKANT